MNKVLCAKAYMHLTYCRKGYPGLHAYTPKMWTALFILTGKLPA